MNSQELINTQEHPGLIVLHGPDPMIDAYGSNFHCYRLWEQIREKRLWDKMTVDLEDEVFNTSLQYDWGVLGLIAESNSPWVWHRENLYSIEDWTRKRYIPMITACLEHWDTFQAEGKRFSNGSARGEDLWALINSLKYVLANVGVPKSLLQAPMLPSEGLKALVPPEIIP
ncbi:MAG: hypothetical protein MUC48_27270 [Leptolyngbya sp. Prado105]|nr:hypothetical protein [Leptolyngbya sp. Prado105]